MYKQNLALNNQQVVIYHKTQPTNQKSLAPLHISIFFIFLIDAFVTAIKRKKNFLATYLECNFGSSSLADKVVDVRFSP